MVSLIDKSQKKDAMKMQRGIGIDEPFTSARVNDLAIHAAPVAKTEHRQTTIVRDEVARPHAARQGQRQVEQNRPIADR